MHLPIVLNEISGITYYPKDSSLFAIQDEEGYLYKIFPHKPDSMMRWKFGGTGDFEDIMLYNNSFYILKSDGDIFHVVINDTVSTVKYNFPDKSNEFESIYYDSSKSLIRIVCKDCDADKKAFSSTYAFDPANNQYVVDSFKINSSEIAHIRNLEKIKFKPSGAAVHPISKKIYLITAVNNLLVVANTDGTIDNAYELDKSLFKQPEGIAFAPDGTMFISNEFAGKGSATLLIYPYQPPH